MRRQFKQSYINHHEYKKDHSFRSLTFSRAVKVKEQ